MDTHSLGGFGSAWLWMQKKKVAEADEDHQVVLPQRLPLVQWGSDL